MGGGYESRGYTPNTFVLIIVNAHAREKKIDDEAATSVSPFV